MTDRFSKLEMKFASIYFPHTQNISFRYLKHFYKPVVKREKGKIGIVWSFRESAPLPSQLKCERGLKGCQDIVTLRSHMEEGLQIGFGAEAFLFGFAVSIRSSYCLCKTNAFKRKKIQLEEENSSIYLI